MNQKKDNLSYYERESDLSAQVGGRTVSIIGVPIELGSDERGLAEAPRYLLKHGLEKMLTSIGMEAAETTIVPCRAPNKVVTAGNAKYLEEITAAARVSKAVVERARRRNDIVISLGGDHSIAIGTIAGAAAAHPQKKLGVIWIDAHPDVNTPETTVSGNIHGMPAATLMGQGHPFLTSIGGRSIAPESILYIGIKDMDKAEIEFLRNNSITTITMLDIERHGLAKAMRAIDALRRKVDNVWISMDMDSIDETSAPGVGMPNTGGLTRREVTSLAQYIGNTCDVVGLDVVEISPKKDVEGKTATLALELIARFLGSDYGWYDNYMDDYRRTNVTHKKEVVHVRGGKNRTD